MTTDITTPQPPRSCTCASGHLNHFSRAASVRCDLGRGADAAAKRFRAIFRPIPDDQREPIERRVERGQIPWRAVWRGLGELALGISAEVVLLLAVVVVGEGLSLGLGWLIVHGRDDILLGLLAGVVMVGVVVSIVRQPRVRAMWGWLKEMYR